MTRSTGCFILALGLALMLVLPATADENLETPRTLRFERTETVGGQPSKTQTYLFAFPDKMRQESKDGSLMLITDHSLGRILVLDRAKKTATTSDTRKSTKAHPIDLYKELSLVDPKDRVKTKDMLVNNNRALAYEKSELTWSQLIWLDEKARPVRMKHSFRSQHKPDTTIVSLKFDYNTELDNSLFDVTAVPEGYSVVDHKPTNEDVHFRTY